MAYAHTLDGKGPSEWEPLERHLEDVAALAGEYAAAFRARDWGSALGRWHDLGKYSTAFQDYLLGTSDSNAGEKDARHSGVDHSTFGAQHAAKAVGGAAGHALAFCIAGHHGGLTDATTDDESAAGASLATRLVAGPPRVPPVVLPANLPPAPALRLPYHPHPTEVGLQFAFFTRMLFSCLVDADRAATEAFCNPDQAAARRQPKPTVGELDTALNNFLRQMRAQAATTPVNRLRAAVLDDCMNATALAPGFFSLDVPTGGGKTLSSLAFALRHGIRHDLRRVVVAIPFTSIIEQTAAVYRKALGPHAMVGLIEHHSNLDPKRSTRANQLAAENWDAPLVVTTNVQLYESLFAAATTPCRKLHRLARSVIVLDEAQTIPIELLTPTLAALRRLVEDYGCSVVLCTATQPALKRNAEFKIGIDAEQVRDIIPPGRGLHVALKRVEVTRIGKLGDDELAERLAAERRVLCVVNTRPYASKLYDAIAGLVGTEGCYHLSTFMCAQHRREKLAEIRERLEQKLPCRLVSTQLIEAGVDVDFPCVYRAEAGFDSIAQAAGRCNREGRLDRGRVYVFESDQRPPHGLLRHAADVARELAAAHPDPLAPASVEAYFRHLYWMQSHAWDKQEVMPCFDFNPRRDPLPLFKFRTAAQRYQIIHDEQASILVPYDAPARSLIARLGRGELDFQLLRDAQRYTVGVRGKRDDDGRVPAGSPLAKLIENHVVIEHESGLWLLGNEAAYSPEKGMSFEAAGLGPESLIG